MKKTSHEIAKEIIEYFKDEIDAFCRCCQGSIDCDSCREKILEEVDNIISKLESG